MGTKSWSGLAGPVMAVAGFALWTAFAVAPLFVGGRIREPWDTGAYWILGLPALMVAQVMVAALTTMAPWRLAIWGAAGHFLAAVLVVRGGTSLGLWPLTLVVLGLPLFGALAIAGLVGQAIGRGAGRPR